MKPHVIPIILSGGSGTRLWPLSRRLRPKQFLELHGEGSLFSQTLDRVTGEPFGMPVVICNDEHRFIVGEELRAADLSDADILLEPEARNTAPAIAAAAWHVVQDDEDAKILVLPSDHLIQDEARFRRQVTVGMEWADRGHLVAFGVSPTEPHTGYGYIQSADPLSDQCWKISKFTEKPDLETAKSFLVAGGYLWNAGIFLFKARTFLDELNRWHPEIGTGTRKAISESEKDLSFIRIGDAAFANLPAISIDYAVMEKTEKGVVVPLGTEWSDVGSWNSLSDLATADADGNVIQGDAFVHDSKNLYVRSDSPLVAAVGMTDTVIVATDDAVLVASKENTEDIKAIVDELRASGREESSAHSRVYRPWGHYQNLERGDRFLVKRIVVNPGAKLSLQLHNHRAEHWVVVKGTARVTNGDDVFDLDENQSTYIPVGRRHRLENPGSEPLHLVEVQTGTHISEDDIERLDDSYGRA